VLRTQLNVIRRRLPVVVIIPILAVIAAVVASLILPKTWESTATLLIGNTAGSAAPSVDAAETAQRLSVTYASVATQRATLQRVTQKLGLEYDLDELAKDVKADAPTDSSIVIITVKDRDPQVAADLANAIAADVQDSTPAIMGRDPTIQASIQESLERTREELLRTQDRIDKLTAIADRTPEQDAQLTTQEARLASLQASFATLLQLASGVSANQATLSDPAVPAEEPLSPNLLVNIALGLVLGVLFGLLAAFVLEQWDDSIRSAADIEHATGLPTLGQIGRARVDAGKAKIYWLASLLAPRSAVAEGYRTLRTNLDFVSVDHPPKTVLVTSPVPGDGKTTVAANLAVALAQSGRSTILVDADLRKPTLHELFAVDRGVGLTTTVTEPRMALSKLVQATEQENLSILPAGLIPPNPAELLATQWFKGILDELQKHADVVVLDSAPVAVVSDAAVISSTVDATLVVVRAGRTGRDSLAHGIEALQRAGARIVGAVLNDTPRASTEVYGGFYVEDAPPPSDLAMRPEALSRRQTSRT
jgi:non-specific protein-tyrosine kinase